MPFAQYEIKQKSPSSANWVVVGPSCEHKKEGGLPKRECLIRRVLADTPSELRPFGWSCHSFTRDWDSWIAISAHRKSDRSTIESEDSA